MRAASELSSPGTDELPVVIEDHHRVLALAGGMHGVMDIDIALGIFADAMRVAVLDGAWQLAPVMNGLVLMTVLPEDWRFRTALVGCTQECRSAGHSCGGD